MTHVDLADKFAMTTSCKTTLGGKSERDGKPPTLHAADAERFAGSAAREIAPCRTPNAERRTNSDPIWADNSTHFSENPHIWWQIPICDVYSLWAVAQFPRFRPEPVLSLIHI